MKLTNGKNIILMPTRFRVYGATDWATMEPTKGKKEPDFTEHGVFGLDTESRLLALDWWSKQAETDKGGEAFIRLVKKWHPIRWWNEGGLIDKSLAPGLRKLMRDESKNGENAFTVLESLPSIQDKGLKLQGFHALAANGMVYGPMNCPWWERVIDQLVKFPGGRWDDAADVCGLIGRAIDKMYDAVPLVETARPVVRPFTESWLELGNLNQPPKVRYFS